MPEFNITVYHIARYGESAELYITAADEQTAEHEAIKRAAWLGEREWKPGRPLSYEGPVVVTKTERLYDPHAHGVSLELLIRPNYLWQRDFVWTNDPDINRPASEQRFLEMVEGHMRALWPTVTDYVCDFDSEGNFAGVEVDEPNVIVRRRRFGETFAHYAATDAVKDDFDQVLVQLLHSSESWLVRTPPRAKAMEAVK